jgi:hypothetical protein
LTFSSPHFGQPGKRRGTVTSYRHATQHTGLRVVDKLVYRGWRIVVEHVIVGMTLRREQYRLRLIDTQHAREEYLTGFASKVTALDSARRRIDFLLDIQQPRARKYRPRRQFLRASESP